MEGKFGILEKFNKLWPNIETLFGHVVTLILTYLSLLLYINYLHLSSPTRTVDTYLPNGYDGIGTRVGLHFMARLGTIQANCEDNQSTCFWCNKNSPNHSETRYSKTLVQIMPLLTSLNHRTHLH